MALIKIVDARGGNSEKHHVVRRFFRGGIGKITKQRKINMLVLVGEKMHFDLFELLI